MRRSAAIRRQLMVYFSAVTLVAAVASLDLQGVSICGNT